MAAIMLMAVLSVSAKAAQYAAVVMDARTGKVLHARSADTRLHPASLTKMMTLYIAFEAVENGEIGLDTKVKISKHAANEPPSKLGLRTGQRVKLRYLIRAAAIKSANDAATAIGEAIEGSEAKFARRMNRTAKAIGMKRTTFKNAHGLTESGHLSTARDMTILGRQLLYDYPEYYNLFSRITAQAGSAKIRHTNRKLLRSYDGADGIKTGYTRAAGFTLTASAERGGERIIATVFGGRSVDTRNKRVMELLDMGFQRAPTRVAEVAPAKPPYIGNVSIVQPSTRTIAQAAVRKSLRPLLRPHAGQSTESASVLAADKDSSIEEALRVAHENAEDPVKVIKPQPRPGNFVTSKTTAATEDGKTQRVITRLSASGESDWGINVGTYNTLNQARKVLLQTALNEAETLDGSLRKVVQHKKGYDANFMGMTQPNAELSCQRLKEKNFACFLIEPGSGA
ncbi:MAG: D-alanyl-D-alanine carboxypeptidase [Roseovarius sp.]|nr:D-alanyl-D-alanine carboxypeptidase [Roseovarius sp.]MCY4291797.1 D-alanyl-D-alanine carboxypeptidase [Roseovarius sp.]MCY4317242.1 D-alanyl-D-alanine carboxypeptidase [Roseovarius sp.]